MLAASFPGEFISWTWLLWVASGVLCLGSFTLVWFHYRRHAHLRQITKGMAIFWATSITLPGLLFAAGALWWLIDSITMMRR